MTEESPDDLLTPGDVGRLFRVDPKTVTKWANKRKLPSTRTSGGHRRFRRGDVEALLAGGARASAGLAALGAILSGDLGEARRRLRGVQPAELRALADAAGLLAGIAITEAQRKPARSG